MKRTNAKYWALPRNLKDGRYECVLKVKNGKAWLIVYEPKENKDDC